MAVSHEDFEDDKVSSVEIPGMDGDRDDLVIDNNIIAFPKESVFNNLSEKNFAVPPLFDGTRETRALYKQHKRDQQDKKILESGEIEKMEPYKNDPEYLVAGQKDFFLGKEEGETKWNEEMQKAPVFTNEELKNNRGEVVDFNQATNYDQLFTMIRKERVVKNDLQQEVPAETIIDDILKLTYQDIRDFDSTDWTRITLRHNLRKTVAKLIRQYKESEEFKMLGGLDWYGVHSLAGIKKEILKRKLYKNANGEMVNTDVLLRYIDEGQVDLLPEVIRLRVKEVAGLSKTEVPTKSVKGVIKKAWRSFKSWFK